MEKQEKREKIKVNVLDNVKSQEHFHQDIELLFVLEGALTVQMGEQSTHMQAEDILVINANKKHLLKASDDILYMQISITYQLVSDVLQSVDVIFWCNSTNDKSERYEELRKVLKIFLNHYLETGGETANFGHIALCYRVLDILSMYFLVQTADKENLDEQDKFDERIRQINNYIRANYNQQISLKELADKLYLSNGYLSRFFKRNYGMSFAEYLTNIRLFHAVDDLLYTTTPITRIAYDNGFANVAVFNKVFKKTYGETPSSVRKKAQSQTEEERVEEKNVQLEARLEKYLLVHGEEKKIENIEQQCNRYSVTDYKKIENYWGNTLNIGSASDLLRSEVREHIILLKEALGIRYIRFWNLFSKDLLIDMECPNGEYNFSRLDAIIDFVLQQGLKPHIEMGMKPKVILYTVQKLQFEDSMDVEFPDLVKWKGVIQALLQHVVHRYGRTEVGTWRLELWFNESKWGLQGADDTYLQLFRILYETAKQYCEEIEVGGCGLRMDYDDESRIQFLKKWRAEPYQPDFLSIMYFAYDRGKEQQDQYAKRSTDNECMKHWVEKEIELIHQAGMGAVKLYITEWNLTASSRNYINDTCFKGAYIIKNVLDMYGQVSDMGYFLGSDRISEYYDSSDLLYGGTGVMSRDGILKPAGFAFEFLRRLYSYYIGKGENYLITTDGHDSYGIVCHNQKVLSYNYYFTKEDELEKEHLWKYYENRDGLSLELELSGMENGIYQIKSYRINEKNGSIFSIWKEMEFERELSRNDIKYFRRVCEPKLTIQKKEVQDGNIKLVIPMEANEIAFVRVRRLA